MSEVLRFTLPSHSTASAKPGPLAPNPELDKSEGGESAPSAEAPQRPEGVPEKFWKDGKVDHDALLKSYLELEKNRGQQPPEQKPKEGEGKEGEQKPKEGEQKQENQPDPKAEVFKPFQEEFARDGKLSEESYKTLSEQHKVDRATVDAFIAGQQALVEKSTADILSTVGGQENYSKMIEWARTGLSQADQQAFDKVINSGDVAAIKLAVAGLNQRYTASEGRQGSRIRGSGGGDNLTPFKTTKEVTDAMSDPRYSSDPDYRKEVEQRLGKSSVF